MSLFPTSSDPSPMERYVVSHQPATTQDLNRYRYGNRSPPAHGNIRPTPLPHTANKNYPSIIMAQRKRDESEHVKKMRVARHHEDIRNQTWIRPMTESAFQIHRPNIHNFNRALNIKMPGWS